MSLTPASRDIAVSLHQILYVGHCTDPFASRGGILFAGFLSEGELSNISISSVFHRIFDIKHSVKKGYVASGYIVPDTSPRQVASTTSNDHLSRVEAYPASDCRLLYYLGRYVGR